MDAKAIINGFESTRDQYLQDLFTLLRFETISAQAAHSADMQACAGWIADWLKAAGLQAEVVATGGHPAVLADTGPASPGGMTLLVYGHYDVQPIGDVSLWKSPAFEPTVRDGAIYARGSADDKGQVFIHMAVMRAIHQTGQRVPVRIKFLIEGEEEIGSPNLPALLREHAQRLACDYVLISDTGKLSADVPSLTQATRGLVYKEVIVCGPDHDLHSGMYGGAVANPANVLAAIIASLHDRDLRVTVPGFYDDVAALAQAEHDLLLKTAPGDAELLKATGSVAPHGELGFTSMERRSTRPTLDVNGMVSGYTGQGAATIIPSRAGAKISMRLVPNQDPARISAAFDQAVRAVCPPTVRLEIISSQGCRAYVAPIDSPMMNLARRALEEGYGRPAAIIREGGTLPILPLFKEVLQSDSVMLGFADPACNLHSPNEFLHVADFHAGVRCVTRLLELAARL